MSNLNYLIGKKQKQYNLRELSRTNDVFRSYDRLVSKMTTLLIKCNLPDEDVSKMNKMIEIHNMANAERNMDRRVEYLIELNGMIKCLSKRIK